MKPRSLLTAMLVVGFGVGAVAFAQPGDLDLTMQVVDDVRDVGRVLDAIERRVGAEQPPEGTPSEGDGDTGRPPDRETLGGVAGSKDERDRDEQSEGELEDYDLPEDAVVDD